MTTELLTLEDISPKIMKYSRASTSFYAEKFLGLYPYKYQSPLLDDEHWVWSSKEQRNINLMRFKVGCYSRQLGKTFSVALKASQKANMFPGSRVGIMAHNERRSYDIYDTVRWMQRRNPALNSLLQPKNDLKTGMTLDLFNEHDRPSKITYYPPGDKGDSIRGDTLDFLILDEGDYIAAPVYSAALPTVSTTHGDIILTSTPGDKIGSMFYNIYMDAWEARQKFEGKMKLAPDEEPYTLPIGRKYDFVGYHYDYFTGLNVINPMTGLPQTDIKIVNIMKADDYSRFEREYLAKWSEESGTYFSRKTLLQQTVENGYRLDQSHGPIYIAGIDWGRMHDYTAITVFEVNENRDMMVAIHTFWIRRQSWQVIFTKIVEILKLFRVEEVIHDKKNVGDTIHVWLIKLASSLHFALRGELMDTVPKSQFYSNAKMGLDMGRIFIQKKHERLLQELSHMVGEDSHITRVQKIHAPEGKFDDLADSFVLGASAIRFQLINDGREADNVPYPDFFDVYEKPTRDDVYSDIMSDDFEFDDFDIKPSFEF